MIDFLCPDARRVRDKILGAIEGEDPRVVRACLSLTLLTYHLTCSESSNLNDLISEIKLMNRILKNTEGAMESIKKKRSSIK